MKFVRYLVVFILVIACCVSIGCDEMQMLDVMDGGPVLPDGYLSLTSKDEDSITPTNDSSEWSNYGLMWEKTKDEELTERPQYAVDWDFNLFEHWIYLEAKSRIVFDFGDRHFSKFECSILLPHFCADTVAIEMKWLANNVEIYNSGVINTNEVVGIAFNIPPRTKVLTLQVIDSDDGINCDHFIIGNSRLTQIPPDLLPPLPDLMLSEAYLSLTSQAPDAITPINDSGEWSRHETWERIRGQEAPIIDNSSFQRSAEAFEHWILSHAESRIVFDLKGQNFTYFECDSRLPNRACGGAAAVEFIWFADDVEIYNSGIVTSRRGIEMAFEIPAGTGTLTLHVTNGDDGTGCDQFIIGEPRLYAEKPEEAVSRDMYRELPEISMTAELEPGRYRLAPNYVDRGDYKIREFRKTIGDTTTDETEVLIRLINQPWDKTADGDLVISSDGGYDEIVVEITKKLEVREEPKGRFTKTIHIYEGIALLNLSNPDHLFEYEEIKPKEPPPYLAIMSETGEAILPSNSYTEWLGWGDSTWGNTKDGMLPPKPWGLLDNPPVEAFEHWFYSHAECRFVYELGGYGFTNFDCTVVLPHEGCGGDASVEVIWLADNVEVYNSGILKPLDFHQIRFEIPAGTQTLTLEVTDGGNGNQCDHFVIGNPRLLLEKPKVLPHVSITPTEIRNPTVGSQFTVNINIAEGVDVRGYNLNINFDSTSLKYVDRTNGDFLRGALLLPPVVSTGSLKLIGTLFSGASNGDGTLVTVTFEAIAAKSSDISLTDVSITNAAGERIETTTTDAKVVIQ